MNKIFLIIVLIASSYGQAQKVIRMGAGNTDCSEFLDYAEDKDSLEMTFHGSYAQGVFATMNTVSEAGLLNEGVTTFAPKIATLRRVLMKYCDENLTRDYHDAVLAVWVANAK